MLETIRSSTDISHVFAHGKRLSSSCITLLVCERTKEHDPSGRVAFIAGKKNGGAVWRNKAKRRMRAIALEMGAPWADIDVVFIAKPATTAQKYSKVLHQAENLLHTYFD